jgi:flavodoxin
MNAFIRFKLGLTEDHPTIKPYDQNKWAETADVKNTAVNISITLLHSLHHRWYELLKTLTEADFKRTVYHPEQERDIPLWNLLLIYARH